MEKEYVTLAEASRLTGLGESTLTRLGDKGVIETYRTRGNHRRFKRDDLIAFRGDGNSKRPNSRDRYIIYGRVSSKKQENDLERQVEFLKQDHAGYEVITDIASGLNFSRSGLRKILNLLLAGTEIHLAVAHKDRLSRFGHELIEYLIVQNGGDVSYSDDGTAKSKQEELAEDLLAVVQVFNCRANGQRRNRKRCETPPVTKVFDEENEVEVDGVTEEDH